MIKHAGAWTEQTAVVRWLHRTAVSIGNADHGVIIRRRGTRLEGFEDGPAAIARTGPHSGRLIDADQLDAGRHLERDRWLVGERKLQEGAGARRRQMSAGRTLAEVARLVIAHVDADDDIGREA